MADNPVYIDTHFHIWELNRFSYQFPNRALPTIFRDVTIDEIGSQLAETPVKYAIFVQVEPKVAVQEADWVIGLAKQHNFLQGVVTGFKLDDPQLPAILDKYQDEKLFLGIRNILDLENNDDWILSDDVIRGISHLVDRELPYHILINDSKHWKYIPDLLKQFPQHKFTIDHMGKPCVIDDVRPGWDEWIAQVARYPNVYCKLSSQLFPHTGPLSEAEKHGHFKEEDNKYVKRCLEVFGVDRCMYGSDYPVCTLHGVASVKEFFNTTNSLLGHLTQQERDNIFGGNCSRFYNLQLS